MIDPVKLIESICEHFEVTHHQIRSESRCQPLPQARKIIIHLMHDHPVPEITALVGRERTLIYQYRRQMNRQVEADPILSDLVKIIQDQCQNSMKLKLKTSQLGSLWEVFEDFLSIHPDSVTLELICLILDEIKEKARKKFIYGKDNITLDDKQLRAFMIWYHHFSHHYEDKHPHGYMTLLDIINQIKPISNVQRITLKS